MILARPTRMGLLSRAMPSKNTREVLTVLNKVSILKKQQFIRRLPITTPARQHSRPVARPSTISQDSDRQPKQMNREIQEANVTSGAAYDS